ncbi:MAG: metallophosphoesterase [Thermoleophilia bacterium]|nr:metallophosphoesterase [Thermoleophilia bacterium]
MTRRVLHISDTHFAAPGHAGEPPGLDPVARLETVLDAVAAEGFTPDLIVHTGDVADDGSADAVERVRARLAAVAPTVAVPGNHDNPAVVRRAFGPPEAVAGPWRVAGIDTVIPGEVGGHSRALAAAVAAADGPTILLMHHPIRSHSTHPWFRVDGGEDGLPLLAASPHPWVVLSGHTHEVYEEAAGPDGRVRLWGGPATHYALRHEADAWRVVPGRTGARLIELGDDGAVAARIVRA